MLSTSLSRPETVVTLEPLKLPWVAQDPFLFCMYHHDAYPPGNAQLGPAASLAGRDLGQDFGGKDGWSMYHGLTVPGFPAHPHRGFETVTIVRQGLVDHADSLGATARYGAGDVQWLTAGGGIVHSEMFPLIHRDQPNPLELFQIWLNLPKAGKAARPHFSIFWSDAVPRPITLDAEGRPTEVTVIAGERGAVRPPAPPPESWAARPESDVAIWTVKLAPHAHHVLPGARAGTKRTLYVFRGAGLRVSGAVVPAKHRVVLSGEQEVALENGGEESELLFLQGRPIAEPVVQYGPFVMNTREEITRAFEDYRRTGFGGWRWPDEAPRHAADVGRFAEQNGKAERP